jgi:hypothetical protein
MAAALRCAALLLLGSAPRGSAFSHSGAAVASRDAAATPAAHAGGVSLEHTQSPSLNESEDAAWQQQPDAAEPIGAPHAAPWPTPEPDARGRVRDALQVRAADARIACACVLCATPC